MIKQPVIIFFIAVGLISEFVLGEDSFLAEAINKCKPQELSRRLANVTNVDNSTGVLNITEPVVAQPRLYVLWPQQEEQQPVKNDPQGLLDQQGLQDQQVLQDQQGLQDQLGLQDQQGFLGYGGAAAGASAMQSSASSYQHTQTSFASSAAQSQGGYVGGIGGIAFGGQDGGMEPQPMFQPMNPGLFMRRNFDDTAEAIGREI